MSKVICDVCGTTYPETAAQCPICGCAKNTTAQTAAGEGGQSAAEVTRTYAKGGRFTKSNVRKRSKSVVKPEQKKPAVEDKQVYQPQNQKNDSANKALAIIIVLLLLAIVAVLIYMGLRVFFPGQDNDPNPGISTTESNPTEPSESTGPSEPEEIPCTSVTLSRGNIEFLKAGDGYMLEVTAEPKNTTDTVTFASSDDAVATVTDTGMITAVGGGQATITITCGDQTAECQISCSFGGATEPTETEPTQPPVTVPDGYVLKLRVKDEFTMSTKYPGPEPLFARNSYGVKATDITWTVDDPKVAAVDENGVVTAVGRGTTTVRAAIGDQTASCKVIVAFDPKPAEEPKYKIDPEKADVTLYVNHPKDGSFRIGLTDKDGVNIEAEWVASEEGYVTINGRNITAVKNTQELPSRHITVFATVDGETYTCIVRIYDIPEEEE